MHTAAPHPPTTRADMRINRSWTARALARAAPLPHRGRAVATFDILPETCLSGLPALAHVRCVLSLSLSLSLALQLPLSLLRAGKDNPMLVELKNGETYNGILINCDIWSV